MNEIDLIAFIKGIKVGRLTAQIHKYLYTQSHVDKIILTHRWMPLDIVRDENENIVNADMRPIVFFGTPAIFETPDRLIEYLMKNFDELRALVEEAEKQATKSGFAGGGK